MADPYISAVVVNDEQKDPGLLDDSLKAIRDLQETEDLERVRFVLLDQTQDDETARKIEAQALPIRYEWCECEIVHGVRLWSVMSCLSRIEPTLKGRYLLVMHKEFVPSPEFFRRASYWARANGEPQIILANLRRLGEQDSVDQRNISSCPSQSRRLRRAIRDGSAAAQMAKSITHPWVQRAALTDGEWVEDACLLRLDWLREIRFFGHSDRQLFQDIFDLLGGICAFLKSEGTPIRIARLPLDVCLYHLWHEKSYTHLRPDIRDWFLSDPGRWGDTTFGDAGLWKRIERYLANRWAVQYNTICDLRRGEGGTLTRYMDAFREWWRSTSGILRAAAERRRVDWPEGRVPLLLFVMANEVWRDQAHRVHAAIQGARSLGCRTEIVAPGRWSKPRNRPSLVVYADGDPFGARQRYEEMDIRTVSMREIAQSDESLLSGAYLASLAES